jgi:putative RNA 2'-phosphotransferase
MSRLPRQLEALSRLLAYVLGHRPDEFNLVLSEDGFIPLKHLLQALAAEPGWGFVRRRHLEELTALTQPPLLEIQGDRVRALNPPPARLRRPLIEAPPSLLYLALPPQARDRVWEQGLKPPSGRELVLAATEARARELGKRRTPDPLLITVQARKAAQAGIAFERYGDHLYLAPELPREFLQMAPPPPPRDRPQAERPPKPMPAPGSLVLDFAQIMQAASGPAHQKGKKGKKGEPAWKAGARALRKGRRRDKQ